MRILVVSIILCGLVSLPHFIFASVLVNEIAWMGSLPKSGETAGDAANNEWMEFWNDGASLVDLTGWVLEAADGVPKIQLAGVIVAGGYFLLERTDDDVIPGIPADQIYSGALSNSGETLTLRDASGAVVDTVDASGGWPAGDNTTKDTMQRSGQLWLTASPTPRAGLDNAATPQLPPAPPPPPATTTAPSIFLTAPAPPPVLSLKAFAGADLTVLAGAVAEFRGQVFGFNGELIPNARFLWNFGDGATQEGKAVTHIYRFPGVYTASLSASSGEYAGSDYLVVSVVPAALYISEVQPGQEGFVELLNDSGERLDIDGVRLSDAHGGLFLAPARTIIEKKTAIVLPNAITGLEPLPRLVLSDARGKTLDEMAFAGSVPSGMSVERMGGTVRVASSPTPGRSFAVSGDARSTVPLPPAGPASSRAAAAAIVPVPEPIGNRTDPPQSKGPASSTAVAAAAAGRVFSQKILLASGIILSGVAAAAFFLLKRGIAP